MPKIPRRSLSKPLALAAGVVLEQDQMGNPPFCVKGKIFAQLSAHTKETRYALINLPAVEQAALLMSNPSPKNVKEPSTRCRAERW